MIFAIIAVLLLLPLPVAAAEARVEAVRVTAAAAARTLNEELWEKAPAVGDFVQREPSEGAKPGQRSEFRVAYDASTLYVKVRATDPRHHVFTRRPVESESVGSAVGDERHG